MQQWYVSECLLAYFFSIEGRGVGISRIVRMRMKSYAGNSSPGFFSILNIKEKDGFATNSLMARSTKGDCFPKFVRTNLRTTLVSLSSDRFTASCPSSSGGLPPSVMLFVLNRRILHVGYKSLVYLYDVLSQ